MEKETKESEWGGSFKVMNERRKELLHLLEVFEEKISKNSKNILYSSSMSRWMDDGWI